MIFAGDPRGSGWELGAARPDPDRCRQRGPQGGIDGRRGRADRPTRSSSSGCDRARRSPPARWSRAQSRPSAYGRRRCTARAAAGREDDREEEGRWHQPARAAEGHRTSLHPSRSHTGSAEATVIGGGPQCGKATPFLLETAPAGPADEPADQPSGCAFGWLVQAPLSRLTSTPTTWTIGWSVMSHKASWIGPRGPLRVT